MRRLAIVLGVLCLPACSGRLEKAVKRQASADLRCPADQVELELKRSHGYYANYDVSACGKQEVYQGACSLFACIAYEPQRVRRRRAGAGDGTGAGLPGEGAPPPDPSAPSGPEGPKDAPTATSDGTGPVELTFRSACRSPARVTFGPKPASAEGSDLMLDGESSESKSLQPGDKIWLVDDDGEPLASVLVEAGMKDVQVTGNCKSLITR